MESLHESGRFDADEFKRLVTKACGPQAKKFRALESLEKGEKRTWLICDKERGDNVRIEGTVVGSVDVGAQTELVGFGIPIREPVFDLVIFHPDGATESLKNARISDQKTFEVKVFRAPTEADWEARSRRIESMCRDDDDEEDEEMVAMTVPPPTGTLMATRVFMPGGLKQNLMLGFEGSIEDRVAFRNLPKGVKPSVEAQQMARALCIPLAVDTPLKRKGRAVESLRTIVGNKARAALRG